MQLQSPNNESTTVNVAFYLRKMARSMPYKRAVVAPWKKDRFKRIAYVHLTFRQLDIESDCVAQGLDEIGISRGVRTILMVKPSLDFFVLVFALFKVGAVPVVVDPGMGIPRMLSCLKESRAHALVGIPPAHVLRKLAPGSFRDVHAFVTVGRKWFWGGHTLAQLRSRHWKPYAIAHTGKNETAAILFTTGSTGPAKGVCYTHGVFDAQVKAIHKHFKTSLDDIDLPTFPLFALFDPALGMTAVIPDMDPTRPARVNPRRIIEAIANQGTTNMFASPALLDRLGRFCRKEGITFPALKRVITAGAPITPANIDQFSSLLSEKAQIFTAYGATEAMPVSAFGSKQILGETRKRSEQGYGMCVGQPVAGVQVRIIRITDDPIEIWTEELALPTQEIGEIAVRGAQVTCNYFERPEQDRLAKIADGNSVWHRMGDLGWLDGKGRIWFCGRKSHRVISGDKQFYTIPCEAVFNNHPRVYRSALVGVGPVGQQVPVICIELEPGDKRARKKILKKELLDLAKSSPITSDIESILFHRAFPVDVRHNAKIFREQLALWAQKKLKR